MRQYIGARYVPTYYKNSLDPTSSEWEANVQYDPLTIVSLPNLHSYQSKKFVPANIGSPALNPEYWYDQGYANAYFQALQDQINDMKDGTVPGSLQDQIESNTSDITALANKANGYYNNVEALKNANVAIDDVVATLGYYSIDDGGKATYQIVDSIPTEFTADDGGYIALNNGLYAHIILDNGVINFRAFGAVAEDNTFDNATILQKCFNYSLAINPNGAFQASNKIGFTKIYVPNGDYFFLTSIDIGTISNIYIEGESNGTVIFSTRNDFVMKKTSTGDNFQLTVENISVRGHGLISSVQAWFYKFKNCRFINIAGAAIELSRLVGCNFEDCIFNGCNIGLKFTGLANAPSTSTTIERCWFAHCDIGLYADYAVSKIITLWVKDSIFEWCTNYGMHFEGNTSDISICDLSDIHTEGNGSAITFNNFSATIHAIDMDSTEKITVSHIDSGVFLFGDCYTNNDIVYNASNNGKIFVKVAENGKTISLPSLSRVLYQTSKVIVTQEGDNIVISLIDADETDIATMFAQNVVPRYTYYSYYMIANHATNQPALFGIRSADYLIIDIPTWSAQSTYTLRGNIVIPSVE